MVTELHFFCYFLTKEKRKEKEQQGENVKICALKGACIMKSEERNVTKVPAAHKKSPAFARLNPEINL
jgi:hypothetical protein